LVLLQLHLRRQEPLQLTAHCTLLLKWLLWLLRLMLRGVALLLLLRF